MLVRRSSQLAIALKRAYRGPAFLRVATDAGTTFRLIAAVVFRVNNDSSNPAEAIPPNGPRNLGEWLDAFLASRNLQEPDGRPLYAYRCTRGELQFLAALLRQTLQSRPGS